MKKLSVIVPVYNAENTLGKCIDSIISQDYPDLEIILIDDGSCDNSLVVCEQYAKRDSRIIVHHKENEGLVAARKTGVELATGEYIGFVDSDDFIDFNMYSSLMKEANLNQSDIVIGGIKLDYPEYSVEAFNLLPAGYYNRKDVQEKIIPQILMKTGFYKFGVIPGVVVKVFRKEIIQESLTHVHNNLTMGEDVAITSYSIMIAASVSIINIAAYHYIQTEISMIRGYNPKRFDAICNMYECISKIREPEYKSQVGAYIACVLYGVLADCAKNSDFTHKEVRRKIKDLLGNEVTITALKSADVSCWGISDKIKFLLMKYKLVGILTLILTR